MACYWGCGTKANKWVYAIMVFFMVAGAAIAIAGGISGSTGDKCFKAYNECQKATGDKKGCAEIAQEACHYKTFVSLIFAGVIIFLAGGFAPMSWFCCCSNDPGKAGSSSVSPGMVVAQPVVMAQPYQQGQPIMAQPYQHGQPVMAQPYQPGQPVMAQAYQPGQPVMAQAFDPATMK